MAADPLRPQSAEQAAESLRELARGGDAVRPLGARTKLDWGPGTSPGPDPREAATTDGERGAYAQEVELETGGLARILAHDRGDFTAVLEAGVPLREAQAAFAAAGQRLAL
ncbi:MAG: hypothetical protein ACYCX7_06480, partial [Solirubrobacteraceae bacterium]